MVARLGMPAPEVLARTICIRPPSMLRILSTGRDSHLMDVRSMLLRESGYTVTEAYSPSEAVRFLQSAEFDLLLICHTFSPAEHAELIASARRRHKPLPVLCLIAREGDGYTGCANVENSPDALMEAIAAQALPVRSTQNAAGHKRITGFR